MNAKPEDTAAKLAKAASSVGKAVVGTLSNEQKRAAVGKAVVDGVESGAEALTDTLNSVAAGLSKDDLTADKIAELAKKGPDAVVKAIKSAGYFASFKGGATGIATMLATETGALDIFNTINGKNKPAAEAQKSGLWPVIMALINGDTNTAKSALSNWFDGISSRLGDLPGNLGQKVGNFIDQIKSKFLGFLPKVMSMVAPYAAKFGLNVEEKTKKDTQVARKPEQAQDTVLTAQAGKKPGTGGLDKASEVIKEYHQVAAADGPATVVTAEKALKMFIETPMQGGENFSDMREGWLAGNKSELSVSDADYRKMGGEEYIKAVVHDVRKGQNFNSALVTDDLLEEAKNLLNKNGISDPDGKIAETVVFQAVLVERATTVMNSPIPPLDGFVR